MNNKKSKKLIIAAIVLVVFIGLAAVGWYIILPSIQYNNAIELYKNEEYLQAAEIFDKLEEYKESPSYSEKSKNKYNYNLAVTMVENKEFEQAIPVFEVLGDFKDSEDYLENCIIEAKYNRACTLMESGCYEDALTLFEELGQIHDSEILKETCKQYIQYNIAEYIVELGNYSLAAYIYEGLYDFEDSDIKEKTLLLLNEYYDYAEDLADGIDSLSTFEGSDLTDLYNNEQTKDIVESLYFRYLYLDAIESIKHSSLLTVQARLMSLPEGYRQRDELLEIVTAYRTGDFDEFARLIKLYAELEYQDIKIPYFWQLSMRCQYFENDYSLDIGLEAYNIARTIKSMSGLAPLPKYTIEDKDIFKEGISYQKRLDSLVELCGENADNKILILYANDDINVHNSNICTYLMEYLPIDYIPKSLDEVEYIISLQISDETVDIYDCGTLAIQEIASIKIVQCPSGKVVKTIGTVKGTAPPNSFTYSGTPPREMRGGSVDQDAALQIFLDAIEDYLKIKRFEDYEYIVWDDGIVIKNYLGTSTTPVVPDMISDIPVISINAEAFRGNTNITNITLPSGLLGISGELFSGCDSLIEITLPDSVVRIGYEAFSECKSLSSINLNEGLKIINSNAFNGCTSLSEINLPDSVYFIGDNVFRDCTNLTSINIPNNLLSIYNECFAGCTGLKSIKLPNTLKIIREAAFSGSGLEEIVLSDSLEYIGNEAFKETSISEISLPPSVQYIDKDAFQGCSSLYEVMIPETVLWIHPENFSDDWMKIHVKEYSCAFTALTSVDNSYVKAEIIVDEIE